MRERGKKGVKEREEGKGKSKGRLRKLREGGRENRTVEDRT